VESKNGSVIRKAWGYDHIPQRQAPAINQWYEDWFNTYLNFHRPCGFAVVKRDKKGKEKLTYPAEGYMTPYEKFRSLPDAEQYLKPGMTFDQLDFVAYAMSDTEFAVLMEQAKDQLLYGTSRRRTAMNSNKINRFDVCCSCRLFD
jgi:hypothetical protein